MPGVFTAGSGSVLFACDDVFFAVSIDVMEGNKIDGIFKMPGGIGIREGINGLLA